jgi:phage terminase small subunit
MPACKTEREERFAMFLAKGLNQTEAYEAAGYKRSGASASKAAQKPGVIARVKELRHQAAYRTRVTLRSLLEQAEDARFGAMTDKQYSAAVAAIREKGILSGLRVEKRNNISRPLNQMSDAELLAIAQSGGLMLDESLTESGFLALPAPGDESEPHE